MRWEYDSRRPSRKRSRDHPHVVVARVEHAPVPGADAGRTAALSIVSGVFEGVVVWASQILFIALYWAVWVRWKTDLRLPCARLHDRGARRRWRRSGSRSPHDAPCFPKTPFSTGFQELHGQGDVCGIVHPGLITQECETRWCFPNRPCGAKVPACTRCFHRAFHPGTSCEIV